VVRYFPPQNFKGHVEHNTNFPPQQFELEAGGVAPVFLDMLYENNDIMEYEDNVVMAYEG